MRSNPLSVFGCLCLIVLLAALTAGCDDGRDITTIDPVRHLPKGAADEDVPPEVSIADGFIPEVEIPEGATPTLVLQTGPVALMHAFELSADDALAATCDGDVIRLWDMVTGRLLRIFEGRSEQIGRPGLSPDACTCGKGVYPPSASLPTARRW